MRRPVLVAAATALVLVPVLVLHGQSTSDQPHGDLKLDCAECHNPEKWVPVGKPPTFRHDTTGFVLESAHAQVSCRELPPHAGVQPGGDRLRRLPQGRAPGRAGRQCEACHTPTTWTNQREMFQVHSRTRFPLFASHSRLDCTACHRNQQPYQYKTTPAECGNCHLPTYLRTTNPNHVQSGFSRRCEDCHNVTSPTWTGRALLAPGELPPRGRALGPRLRALPHRRQLRRDLERLRLLPPGRLRRRPRTPTTRPGGFPTTCESCHTINALAAREVRPPADAASPSPAPTRGWTARSATWAAATRGPRRTATPATRRTTRARRTPTTRPPGFPTQCQSCHNTGAWRPANFDHNATRFPLTGAHTSGRLRAVPRGRPLHGDARRTATPATRRTTRRRRTPTTRRRVPVTVPELPHHERVEAGELRPRRALLPDLLGQAPGQVDELQRVPRERRKLQGLRVHPLPRALEQGQGGQRSQGGEGLRRTPAPPATSATATGARAHRRLPPPALRRDVMGILRRVVLLARPGPRRGRREPGRAEVRRHLPWACRPSPSTAVASRA